MVIVDAELYMYKRISSDYDFYVSGLMASIRLFGINYMCGISEQGNPNIPVETKIVTKIYIVTGEWNIKNIRSGVPFQITAGGYVFGEGVIKEVLEIYVEKRIIELRKDLPDFKSQLREVIDIASSLDNAIIEEGVVEMLDE